MYESLHSAGSTDFELVREWGQYNPGRAWGLWKAPGTWDLMKLSALPFFTLGPPKVKKLFQKSSGCFHLLPIPKFVLVLLNSHCTLQPVTYLPVNHGLCFQPRGSEGVLGEIVREALSLLWLCGVLAWLPLLPSLSLERWTYLPLQGWG